MSRFVVDASVAVKWYLPEPYSAAADLLLNPDVELLAPELLYAEMGNILWKRVSRGECPHSTAVMILKELELMPLQIWSTRILAQAAFDISCRTKRTFYDSLYIALAVVSDCPLVTADRKLLNALREGIFKKNILWIEEVPR